MAKTTILDVIKSVLPNGTTRSMGWDAVCEWPPDLFAAVATIAERSGLYSEQSFTARWASEFSLGKAWIDKTRKAGKAWATLGTPPQLVQSLWNKLIRKHYDSQIEGTTSDAIIWKTIVFQLIAIADEACAGIGFFSTRPTVIQYLFVRDYLVLLERDTQAHPEEPMQGGEILPYIPHSLCLRVPPDVLCVQPKTNTPAVGCTLRSLTHNLALLPPLTLVKTRWDLAFEAPQKDRGPFNILVVPFPFFIPGKSFIADVIGSDHVFTVNPDEWTKTTPGQLADFLLGLIKAAEPEAKPVHALVLPETALRLEFAKEVASILSKGSNLDLFLVGVLDDSDGDPRNFAALYRFISGTIPFGGRLQSKHHRWCLDGDQIRRYQLGHVFDPLFRWWEKIDVSCRYCNVMAFQSGAALSVLVCEDLARYDPVLPVMNAIGPSLVVALLQDGPQLEHRWPGRYATVLADDPGSAVLTVTSLGMVARSTMPGEPQNREIALWKEPNGQARSLKLPKRDHALLLTLTSRWVEQFTLDGRGDGKRTVNFSLGAARGIRHPNPPKAPGGWLEHVDD